MANIFDSIEIDRATLPAFQRGRETPYDDIINEVASRYGIEPAEIKGIIDSENPAWNPRAESGTGPAGLMQISRTNARNFGVTDIYDPRQNIEAGAKLWKELKDKYNGNEELALADWHTGPSAVIDGKINPTARDINIRTAEFVPRMQENIAKHRKAEPPKPNIFDTIEFDKASLPAFGGEAGLAETRVATAGEAPATEPSPPSPVSYPQARDVGVAEAVAAAPATFQSTEPATTAFQSEPEKRYTDPLPPETPEELQAAAEKLFASDPEFRRRVERRQREEKQFREAKKDVAKGMIQDIETKPGGKIITTAAAVGRGLTKALPFGAGEAISPRESTFGQAIEETKPASVATGEIGGLIASQFVVGSQLSGLQRIRILTRAAKAVRNPVLRKLAQLGVSAIPRTLSGTAVTAANQAPEVAAGTESVAQALQKLGGVAGANAVSVLPEVLLPRNLIQPFAQALTGLAYNYLYDKSAGTEYRGKEKVLGIPKQYIVEAVADGIFGAFDVETGTKINPGESIEGKRIVLTEPGAEAPPADIIKTPERPPRIEAGEQAVQPALTPEARELAAPRPAQQEAEQQDLFHTGQREEILENQVGAIKIGKPANAKPGKPVLEGVRKTLRKWMTSKGDLPQQAFAAKILKEGKINVALRDIDRTVSEFHKTAKKVYGRSRLDDATAFELDAALKGEAPVENLPEQIQPVIQKMRSQIDAFSQRMIDAGLVEGDLAAIVSDNMGLYANRSYRVFDDPAWAKKVPEDVRNNAKAFLRQEYSSRVKKLLGNIESRLDALAGRKAHLQQQSEMEPARVSRADEQMMDRSDDAAKIIRGAVASVQRAANSLSRATLRKLKTIQKRREAINARKTAAYRGRPWRPGELERLQKQEAAIEKSLDALQARKETAIEGEEGALLENRDLVDDINSRIDALQGELSKTVEDIVEHPMRLEDIGDTMTRLNIKLRDLDAAAEKAKRIGLNKTAAAIEKIQNGVDRALFSINKLRTEQYRAPGTDVTGGRNYAQEISDIDTRIDELGAMQERLRQRGDLSEDEVEGRIGELLYKDDAPISILSSGSKLGSKNLSMLRRRKTIPAQIRALWGEYKNADVNYARSVYKMANAIANHQFLQEVRAAGEGTLFHAEPTGEFHARISAENYKPMAPLDGMYTTPEIKKAFEDAVSRPVSGPMLRLWMKAIGITKYSKTILSPMTHLRNTTGNIGFAIANGHFNIKNVPDAFKATFGDVFNASPKELQGEIQDLIRLGVLSDGARARELRNIINEATQGDIDVLVGTGKRRAARRALRVTEKLYGAEDDVWKFYAFRNEMARYRKALPDMPEAELKQHVAGIVRDTYPTYSMVPRALQSLRRFPVLGTFISFPAEVVRTAWKTARLTQRELSDPRLRNIGAQRLAGMAMAASLPTALSVGSRYLTGTTKEKEDAQREFLPPWSQNSEIIHTGTGGDTDPNYIDLSYTNPHAYLRTPAIALMRGEDPADAIIKASAEAFAPFISEDIFTQKLLDLSRKRTENGQPVYNPKDPEAWMDIAAHFYDAIEPGVFRGPTRIRKALQGQEGKAGASYDAATEAIAQATGVRISKNDIPRSLRFKAYRFGSEERDITRLRRKRGADVSEQEATKLYDDFSKVVNAARKAGMSDEQIYVSLREGGFSTTKAQAFIAGEHRDLVKFMTAQRAARESIYSRESRLETYRAEAGIQPQGEQQ